MNPRALVFLVPVVLLACKPPVVGDSSDTALEDTAPPPSGGIIAATSGTQAIDAGLAVLDEGGTAVDAAMTVAMSQIVLTMGSWNSFAGIMGAVVYDAESGELSSLHGNYRTFEGETDPMTIPTEDPSGRTAMVGGYMAAAEAAWSEHGVLPWERVLEPAIQLAEEGFEADVYLDYYIRSKEELLSRREETWAVFTDEDGEPWEEGDIVTQPALAETLRAVAEQGSTYMYTGDWADHFVEAVSEEGGAVTADDLAVYTAAWTTPLETTYADQRVVTMGDRELGSVQIVEALNMAEVVGLASMDPWWESGESLYWIVRITQVNQLLGWIQDYYPDYASYVTDALPGVELTDSARTGLDQAELLVTYVQDGTWDGLLELFGYTQGARGSHSDAMAVMDARGNAVALTHSINTTMWGSTGIFVDGVSIPDSASFQQQLMAQLEPGAYLPTPLNPVIVLEDGVPVLAGSTVGNVHYAQVQRLIAVLGHGLTPEEAVDTPMLSGWGFAELVASGDFPSEVLEDCAELGWEVAVGEDTSPPYWVGVAAFGDGTHGGGVESPLEAVGARWEATGLE